MAHEAHEEKRARQTGTTTEQLRREQAIAEAQTVLAIAEAQAALAEARRQEAIAGARLLALVAPTEDERLWAQEDLEGLLAW